MQMLPYSKQCCSFTKGNTNYQNIEFEEHQRSQILSNTLPTCSKRTTTIKHEFLVRMDEQIFRNLMRVFEEEKIRIALSC